MFKEFYNEVTFNDSKPYLETLRGKVGDTKSRGLYVTVIQNNVIIDDLTGLSMDFVFIKPDGTKGINEGVVAGTRFRIDYTNQVFAVEGTVRGELVLRGASGEKITSRDLTLLVTQSIVDGEIISEDERGILDKAFELAEDIIPRIELIDIDLLEEVTEQRQQDQLKVAKLEKELNDYKSTMANVNVNQEAKQNVSGYGVVSLPKNSANGQVSVGVKGRTLKNELNYNRDTWAEWAKFGGAIVDNTGVEITGNGSITIDIKLKPSTNYGFLLNVVSNNINGYLWTGATSYPFDDVSIVLSKKLGNVKAVRMTKDTWSINSFRLFTSSESEDNKIKIRDIRLFELPIGSEIETDFNTMTADQLATKYPYVSGDNTKSTISASRLKSVGKNLIDLGDFSDWSSSDYYSKPINLKQNTDYTANGYNIGVELSGSPVIIMNSPRYANATSRHIIILTTGQKSIRRFNSGMDKWYIGIYIPSSTPRVIFNNIFTNYNVQLEEGTVATSYEPYTESTQYLPNVGELRSLPNGTKDEVSGSQLIKRVSDDFRLTNITNWVIGEVGETTVRFHKVLTGLVPNYNYISPTKCYIDGLEIPYSTATGLSYGDIEKHSFNDIGILRIRIRKDRLSSVDSTGLSKFLNENQVTLTYQLTEPSITPINVSGDLISYPSGTIYIEHGTYAVGLYGENGITVTETELPIKEINKITKIDYETGLEHELDVSKAIVSEDGLLFTHEDLEGGDIVFFDYDYSTESTQGETTIEYYDSRYVIEDTENGNFYQWKISSTNGTPNIELVEV